MIVFVRVQEHVENRYKSAPFLRYSSCLLLPMIINRDVGMQFDLLWFADVLLVDVSVIIHNIIIIYIYNLYSSCYAVNCLLSCSSLPVTYLNKTNSPHLFHRFPFYRRKRKCCEGMLLPSGTLCKKPEWHPEP